MKFTHRHFERIIHHYPTIPLATGTCMMLCGCFGGADIGTGSYKVNIGSDDGSDGSLRYIMEQKVQSGERVSVERGVNHIQINSRKISISANHVTLIGNGDNRLHYALADAISPALNNDTQAASNYVTSGALSANASNVADQAQHQGLTKITGGKSGLFSANNFSMRNIHVDDTSLTSYGNIAGGMVNTSGKSGNMTDTVFTHIAVRGKGSHGNITGGVIGAYAASKIYGRGDVGEINRSLFDHIYMLSTENTINGGAIGVEGRGSSIGNIGQTQFSNFTVDSGHRVVGGAVGAISNGGENTAQIGSITNSLFTNFDIRASNFAVGGAVGMAVTGNATQTGIGNTVFANMRIAANHITGGAIGLRSDWGSSSMNNIHNSYFGQISSTSNTQTVGGAIGLFATGNVPNYAKATMAGISDSVINQIDAFAAGNVYGGAIGVYTNTGHASIESIQNSFIQNNSAKSNASAFGGALSVYTNQGTAQLGTIQNSAFINNRAESKNSAYGGAIYTAGLQNALNITNSTFLNNTVSSQTNAYGGAIFIDTRTANNGNPFIVNLLANNGGKTVFQGNTVQDSSGQRPNAIHFGIIDGSNSAENAVLNISPAWNSEVALHDPVTVAMNNGKKFTLNMTGNGVFYWDGNNILAAQGSSQVNMYGGTTVFGNNFRLSSGATPLQVQAAGGSNVEFMGGRNRNTPLFDFTGAPTGNLNMDNSVRFGVSSRQLTNVSGVFLIAKGLNDYSTFNPQNNGSVVSYSTSTPGELKVTVDYVSPYRAALERSSNTLQAQDALNTLVSDTMRVTDNDFAEISENLSDATAEYSMTQALVALNTNQSVLRTAKQLAYSEQQRLQQSEGIMPQDDSQMTSAAALTSVPAALSTSPLNRELHVWGGYIGDFPRARSYGNYQGYKTDTHGVVFGASYDLTPQWNLGGYAAYTNGKTRLRNENTRTETDGYHMGLTSSYAFSARLNLQADIGIAHYSNDGKRCLGSYCSKSDFDQNLFSLGGELTYLWNTQSLSIRPFGGLRYTYIQQGSFNEYGGPTASHVDRFHLNSVSSSIGASVSRVFESKQNLWIPEISLAWRHEWGDRQANSTSHYTAIPDQSFVIGSYRNNRDFADFSLRLSSVHNLKSGSVLSTFISTDLGISEHTSNRSVNIGLQLQF